MSHAKGSCEVSVKYEMNQKLSFNDRRPQTNINDMLIIVDRPFENNSVVTITDSKHGKSLVAGDNYDNHVYHQDAQNRNNSKWILKKHANDLYTITDYKHGYSLVAGDKYDNHVYHQDVNYRPNGYWTLDRQSDGTFIITDHKHNKSLVAGDNCDNHVYHQDVNGRPNGRWRIKHV